MKLAPFLAAPSTTAAMKAQAMMALNTTLKSMATYSFTLEVSSLGPPSSASPTAVPPVAPHSWTIVASQL